MYIDSEKFENLKYIGEGEEGVVRKKGKYALKKFFSLQSYKKVCLEPQYRVETSSFILPSEKLYIDDNYIGCVNDYVVGKSIDNYTLNDFENFSLMVKKLESELELLSRNKITILDLIPRNALITDSGFKVIDTTKYQITDDYYECMCTNVKRLNYFFTEYILLKNIDKDTFFNLLNENEKLFEYFYSLTYVEAHTYLSRFLEYFMEEFHIKTKEEYNQKVLTLR